MSAGRSVADTRRLGLGLGLGLVLAIAACHAPGRAKDSPAPPMSPSKGGAERDALEQRLGGDDIDQLEAELERARSELLALDDERVAASTEGEGEGAQPGATPPSADAVSRCERVAALAGRICQLRDRMCALATEHDQQPRYAEACGRAEQTCAQAQQATEDCAAA